MSNETKGQDFLAELASIQQDLPYSLTLLRDLFSQTGESSLVSLEDIGKTIAQDQGLTTKVLAMANSAFYGLQSRVTSVGRAIALLGLKEIRNLVLILGAQSITTRRSLPEAFDLEDYWGHQLGVGLCARHLGARLGKVDCDVLFTAGLLHDFGKLLTAMYRPNCWVDIVRVARTRGLSYAEAEQAYWGLEHGLIGAMTLNAWYLPRELTEPVNWHHSPELSEGFSLEAKTVCLADALHHRRADPFYTVPPSALAIMDELGVGQEELLVEAGLVLQDDSLAQFLAHIY